MMDNPWRRLPEQPPFVLPEDLPSAVPFQLHCRMPMPWQGPIVTASVILLLRSAGHDLKNFEEADNAPLMAALRRQLSGRQPFIALLPEWRSTAGADYWRSRLRLLIEEVGWERVAERFGVAQAIPYASSYEISPMGPLRSVPSSAYTANLVREAQARSALIIVGRAEREWRVLAPELFAGEEVPVLQQPRAMPNITPQRLGDQLYASVVSRLLA